MRYCCCLYIASYATLRHVDGLRRYAIRHDARDARVRQAGRGEESMPLMRHRHATPMFSLSLRDILPLYH